MLFFWILCLGGFLIAAYFTSLYLGISVAPLHFLAQSCRIDTGQCQRVIETKESQLFGLPNFVLGLIYYLILMILSIVSFPFHGFLVVISWGVVAISLYLAFQLYYVLKMPCVLCYTSHFINFCIAILLSFI